MWDVLTKRRWKEKTIAYAESHDQAIVGDKSVAFWLMDKEMYYHMSVDDPNLVIDRGIALHKMIRMITMSLGGEGYLNFMGNEFGHPEWIDFPRLGNNWSYKYARRQWTLVDNPKLKYKYLDRFDKAMVRLVQEKNILPALPAKQINMDESNKVIIFERNNLIFVFNFHSTASVFDYRFPVDAGKYRVILCSDNPYFGGFGRIDTSMTYETFKVKGTDVLSIYLTNRTVIVLERVTEE